MLPVSNVVRVTVNLSPTAAAQRNFGTLLIAGDSTVISAAERVRTYLNIEGVALDFGTTAPEYLAAVKYFGQTPTPAVLMIGRWVRVASAAMNIGGILAPSEQSLSLWTNITNGGFIIHIDGVTKTLTGLDFSAQTNLNGIATVITTALSGAGTCVWDGTEFTISSATSGAGVKATGTITVATLPTAMDTVTVNGTVITFVASGATGSQVNIGSDAPTTAANLQLFLRDWRKRFYLSNERRACDHFGSGTRWWCGPFVCRICDSRIGNGHLGSIETHLFESSISRYRIRCRDSRRLCSGLGQYLGALVWPHVSGFGSTHR